MTVPTLIYCAGGNKRFSDIARECGFMLGARLPGKNVYHDLYFVDQDWKKPDRKAYMAALASHRPVMATVLDWERETQLTDVLNWAEEASQFVQKVLIVPKVFGGISRLPRRIGQADVVLGYSMPTRYGGTQVPIWEFSGWPVHLLGGSPQAQAHESLYMDVISMDGNMTNLMATRHCRFWCPGTATGDDKYWQALESGYSGIAPEIAFRRSCENIMAFWDSRGRREWKN